MVMKIDTNLIKMYIKEINKIYSTGIAREHTYRPAFVTLINGIDKNLQALNEQKQIECGSPDITILKDKHTVGHVEFKDVGKSLDDAEKTEQIERYLKLDALIISDYLEFRLFINGERKQSVRIASINKSGKVVIDETKIDDLVNLLIYFLDRKVKKVEKAKDLATRMAHIAKGIQEHLFTMLKDGNVSDDVNDIKNSLTKVNSNVSDEKFTKMYAQTIAYGFFMAKWYHKDSEPFTRQNAVNKLPETTDFLKCLFKHVMLESVTDESYYYLIEDMVTLLANTDMDKIRENARKEGKKNLALYFYEIFLGEFDKEEKKSMGVFYTPEQIVAFMVKSVDSLLKSEFNIQKGIADTQKVNDTRVKNVKNSKKHNEINATEDTPYRVNILDPAGGTGTFLHETIRFIRETSHMKDNAGMWASYVDAQLIPRLQMFEIMIASHTIAHLNLHMAVTEQNENITLHKPFNIWLANTLDDKALEKMDSGILSCVKKQISNAYKVKKDFPIMVIMGNPPYNGNSANVYDIEAYKYIDGVKLIEKAWKPLNDDYVKFIRWSQLRIEAEGCGMIAFITSNSYLDNVTFRGMRKSLMDTFNEIDIINLHGDVKKKCPDGSKDENVFDITIPVTITIFIKKQEKHNNTIIKYAELYGTREDKFNFLNSHSLDNIEWEEVKPQAPNYMFKPTNGEEPEYLDYVSLTDIFTEKAVGLMTGNDAITMKFSKNEVVSFINEFVKLSDEEGNKKYNTDNGDWQFEKAKKDIVNTHIDINNIVKVLYRPYDFRYTYFTGNSTGIHNRPSVLMCNMANRDNLAIVGVREVSTRQNTDNEYNHVFITNTIADKNTHTKNSYVFPLYTYCNNKGKEIEKKCNINHIFIEAIENKLKIKCIVDFSYEDVIYYIYAIINSPMYRSRYITSIKYDYPKIPILADVKKFKALCKFGKELTETHLMKNNKEVINVSYPVTGDNTVSKVKYEDGKVFINKTQYFGNIPEEVYKAVIGGYQVVYKWLNYRKDMVLSYEDIEHVEKMLNAIAISFKIQEEIDSVIGSFTED